MMIALEPSIATSLDAEMFLRLWNKQKLTPTLARHILKLDFDPDDDTRMHELATKNSEGEISPGELAELDRYIQMGGVLTILKSRARKLLKKSPKSSNGRG